MTTTVNPTGAGRALTSISAPSIRRDELWIPAGVLLAALVVFAGWLLLVSPQHQQAASLQGQTATTTSQADALQRRLATLTKENGDLPRYRAELAAAQAALPTTSALPDFLRALQDIGTATGVTVSGMSATPPTAVTANGAVSNGPVTTAAVAPTAYRVTISVTAKGSYDALAAFVGQLQRTQPRAVLITSATEQADDAATSLTLSLDAFMAPGTGGAQPAAK